MAKPAKGKIPAGTARRVTPKGGTAAKAGKASGGGHAPPPASARYTPPIPKEFKVSPLWVPVLMGVFLALGVLVILLNYVSLLPTWGFLPDDTSNIWLLVGLGFILLGIVVATQWH